MSKTTRDILIIIASVIISSFVIYLPYILKINFWGLDFSSGIGTIYRNFDGLEYIIIAKSFYNPSLIANIPQSLSANYFAAHFPGFPILITLFAPFLGFLKSMIFVSLLFTIFAVLSFYFLVKDFKLSSNPLLLSLVFLILPARWIIVRSVGSPEPVFITFIILSLYFFMKNSQNLAAKFIWLSAIFGALAQLTRPPGVLLFIALALFICWQFYLQKKTLGFKKAILNHFKFYPFLLVPLTLIGIFYLYSINYGDFWAYFHSGDNIHLTFPPYQVFNKSQFWVGDIWLEDIIYIFVLGFLGGILLLKQKLYPMAFFVLTYLTAAIFVAHRDISRYILPIFPFVLIAFEKVLVSREFKIVLIIVAAALYLYSQNFILNNSAPVPNLTIYN